MQAQVLLGERSATVLPAPITIAPKPSGSQCSGADQDVADLAEEPEFFRDLVDHDVARDHERLGLARQEPRSDVRGDQDIGSAGAVALPIGATNRRSRKSPVSSSRR